MLTDLQYALRRMKAAPGFTGVAVLTLALGLGTTIAIYSVVDAVMLRPLPYRDADRLFDLAVTNGENITHRYLTGADWEYWRQPSEVFAAIEAHAPRRLVLTGDGEPQILSGTAVSGGLMAMLGTPPQLGRTITAGDARPGAPPVAVLGDALWRTRFAADRLLVGRTIRLDDVTYEVVGVMPPDFSFPLSGRQVWVPLVSSAGTAPMGSRLSVTVRLSPDLGLAAAQVRVDARRSGLESAALLRGWRVMLVPLLARDLHRPFKRAMYVLSGAAVLVLLISCANIANLLLVQGAGRRREVAVRAALGAARGRLLRQFLTETLLLAVAGGALGLLAAQWAIELLAAFVPPSMSFGFLTDVGIRLDGRALAFAAIMTLATTLTFGLVPAIRGSRAPHTVLRETTSGTTAAPGQERLRGAFVLVQMALAVLLLVGAGLLVRTFVRVTSIDPGFDTRNVVAADLTLPRWKYPTRAAQQRFFDELAARVRTVPGVVSTTLTGGVPPSGGGFSVDLQFEIEGRGVVLDDPAVMLPFSEVDGDYFKVLGIPLRIGRTFGPADTPESPRVVIVSETMARRLWGDESPVGTRLRWSPDYPWYTVVAVVGDVYQFRHDQPRGQFAVYYANSQSRGMPAQQTFVVRTAGDARALIPSIRQQIWSVDSGQPIQRIETLESAYAAFFAAPRFYAALMAVFALVGLTIAAVGLYGVVAYATAQRTREFGVRLALGAGPRDLRRRVLAGGALLAAGGIAAGVLASFVFTRLLASLLVDVHPTDALTYLTVIVALAAVALVATWIPARRATRIDPVQALRHE